VRYALEGSVQRAGSRMRVNVQLVDAENGSHLWAERFDKPIVDLFDMQDEIVSRLANRLGQELAAAEARRAERAATPDSMDHYFLGLGYYNKTGGEFLEKARSHFDRALELDPENVDALIRRAWVDLNLAAHYSAYLSDDRSARLRFAEADLGKAIKLRPDSAAAHVALGYLRMCSNRVVEGIAECERALAIDRNLASAHAFIGSAKNRAGRSEETEAHVLEALRISPRDTYAFGWMLIVGFAKLLAGRDEEAIVWLNRSIGLNPNHPTPHCLLAAALAHLGRMKEAREAARAGLELNPGFTVAGYRASTFSDNPVYLAGRERVAEGMHKAGLPAE
jgi:tetratricopeptide (TPR) repeat protein